MKRRKLPSFKEHAEEHHKRTNAYVERHVSRLSEEMVRDTLRTLELLGIELSQDEALSLTDYPELRQPLLNIRKRYAQGLETAIVNGAVREWAESNNLQDLFVRRVLKERGQDERAERFIHYFKPNTEARNAFIKRKEQGLGLSDKVWNVSGLMQSNLEQALATAIEDGWDAVTLSKRVSQYLRDFPTMQRDYRLRYGRASRIEDAEYRSARLARTEINMAYRRAEQSRWADMDFVVGYEIKRSGRGYSCSVCDALAGKYPKDFVWHTWHPNCRCYAVPILNTDDEFFTSPLEAKETNASPSVNEVTDTPEGFRSWLSTNEHRIVQARERGTLPYFIRYNPKYSTPQKVKRERPKRTSEEAKEHKPRRITQDGRKIIQNRLSVRYKIAQEMLRYKGITFEKHRCENGGCIETPINAKQNKQEQNANYMTARILARDGARVRLLPIIDNDKKKNPDAINLKTGILIDFKNAQGTNGKNAVQSAIKEASKQGVEEVVIRFQEKIDGWATLSLARGLKAGLLPGRARNLSLITIISPTGEKVSLNVKDIRERIDRLGKKKKG